MGVIGIYPFQPLFFSLCHFFNIILIVLFSNDCSISQGRSARRGKENTSILKVRTIISLNPLCQLPSSPTPLTSTPPCSSLIQSTDRGGNQKKETTSPLDTFRRIQGVGMGVSLPHPLQICEKHKRKD